MALKATILDEFWTDKNDRKKRDKGKYLVAIKKYRKTLKDQGLNYEEFACGVNDCPAHTFIVK